ncbi:glycosyltransferase family 4 protein [Brevundimonas bacteroides]|uniref:glycosyltransferase family 4 protein n=1 Tax=Brevundimonas bacteroides TaxID=74311 RepID=UPI000A00A13E|nr:glycosyltransferase family 4 protein [Brevundimonas bacteroides]
MKIVMICEFFNESLEYQENLLAKYYTSAGHDVVVVSSTFENVFDYYNDNHDPSVPARTYWYDGVKVIKLQYAYNLLNRLRAYAKLKPVLEAEKPDLIYMHCILPNVPELVSYVKRHPDCRMIMDYHADYTNSGRNQLSLKILHGVIRKWFLDQARPYISRIFPIVPAGFTFLEEVYGVPRTEMELLPLGTDLPFGREVRSSGARGEVRRALGIPESDFVVFTGGKLHPLKRTEDLLAAVGRIGSPRMHVLVVGEAAPTDKDYEAELRRLAGPIGGIHFLGWQDKSGVYRHMAAADVAVFPASQSVMWQQAIGMGLPVIVNEVSNGASQDVGYLNRYDNLVILKPSKDLSPEIADHLSDLMTNPERLRAMGEGALKTADEILDWAKLIEVTLRFNRQEAAADVGPDRDAAA